MNLYQITEEYNNVFLNLHDHETGELDNKALEQFELLSTDLKNKTIALTCYIQNLSAERKAINDATKAMKEREDRLNKRIDGLTDYLKDNMEKCGMSEVSCPYFTLRIKNNPVSVEDYSPEMIPDEYKNVKQVISINKTKIKDAIQQGKEVPGTRLVQKTRLEIK